MLQIKKALSLLVCTALMLSMCLSASAESTYLSLGSAQLDEMFTERDFDPSYDSAVDITLSDGNSASDSKAVRIDRDNVTITQEGVYRLSGSLSKGQIVVYAPDNAKVQLVLDGVSITNEGGAAIEIARADKVFITSAEGSHNSLASTGALINKDVDAAVFSRNDICFNGWGMLKISSESGHGIATKDDLKICSGSYEIQAEKRGLSGKDSIRIGGGSISVDSRGDGLHSAHDDADKGYIFIAGGDLKVTSGKDGIDCTNYLSIVDGKISIVAESDGINAAGTNDLDTSAFVAVSGGVLSITAKEDGIDSNGSLGVSGGEIYISAAPGGGDAALDYGVSAEISGGLVAAASAKQMAQNFSLADAQGSMLCSFAMPHRAGEEVRLSGESGNLLLSFVPELDFDAVLLSCPGLEAGGSYTVSAGDETLELSMDGSLYGGGFGPGGPEAGMVPPPEMGKPMEPPRGIGKGGLFGKG